MYRRFVILLVAITAIALGSVSAFGEPLPGQFFQVHSSGLNDGAWPIEKGWDRQAELEFAEWVAAIGAAREQQSFRLISGLKNPKINPLYTPEDDNLIMKVDCGELPYAMRAYFAYKTKRPWGFVANRGKRYRCGNRPTEFMDFSQFRDFQSFSDMMLSRVTTATYRMAPKLEGTDSYPIDITEETLLPGTIYYDPNGHVLIVYRVDNENGDIFFLDSHPDGTLTRKVFNPSYGIGTGKAGGGFKAWRHFTIEAIDKAKGSFRLLRELNKDAYAYSATAQYQGTYDLDGFKLTYHEWVRARISKNGIYVFPVPDFSSSLDTLCMFVQERVGAVNEGLAAGVHLKPHPNELPYNIYGAEGEWEEYSSPGRDARMRFMVFGLRALVARSLRMAMEGDGRLKYDGGPVALYSDLVKIWNEHVSSPACQFEYTNSAGGKVKLSLVDVFQRIYDMSFDPYHCPELRWGAPMTDASGSPTAEFSTCPDGRRKLMWYEEEGRLRNRMTRLLNRSTATHCGPENPADISVVHLFACYESNRLEFGKCHQGQEEQVLAEMSKE